MRRLGLIVAVASAAACAGYTIVYLYRWEWHRALMAGIFLVVAEVALAAVAILRRLAALDARLDALPAAPTAGRADDVLGHLRETAPPPRPVFAWLTPDGSTTNVFLPILLGAGVLASAAAWVVETLARATARPVLERRLAARLGALALPAGGLLRPAPAAPIAPAGRRPRPLGRAALSVAVVWGAGLGVAELADATQTRPHQPRTGVHTVVELELRGELAAAIPERVVASLWQSCAGTLRSGLPDPVVTDLDGSRFRLEVPTDLGVSTSRRIHGCLEDAALDRVQARVVRLSSSPVP